MTIEHTQFDFWAGDDWEINATLLDENGNPYNLSPLPGLEWALMDRNYKRVINNSEVSFSITDAPAGKCTILIPSEVTTDLVTGVYNDALRITIGGVTSTLSVGQIHVVADGFR